MGGIVGNRYYNDPNIGRVFEGLAQLYAPPGARDLAALAQADARRQEATRRQQLFESGATPSESAALSGVQGYGQTPQGLTYGVDKDAETARYGYDQSLAGTKYTADQALKGNQFDTLYSALGEGEVRPAIPANEAAMFGLEGAIGGAAGVPTRPSQDEVLGANLQTQMRNMTDDQLLGLALGDQTVIVQGPNGPIYSNPGVAAATGAPAYVNKGAEAAAELLNWQAPNGASGTAVFDRAQNTWIDTQTQAPIPAGSTTFKAQAEGGRNDVVGATTANVTRANDIVAEAQYGIGRAGEFRALLENNPGVLGLPGMLRGFAQDLVSAMDEAMAASGGAIGSLEEAREVARQVGASGRFDPAIAQAGAFALEMAYLQAKMQDPSGEVNVRELERLLSVYDGGIAGNQKVLANLDVLEKQFQDRIAYGQNLRVGGGNPAPSAPPPAQTGPAVGAIESGYRFLGGDPGDPNSWEPVN